VDTEIRLAPVDQTVLYALQRRSLNGPLNLEDVDGFSIYRVSLNDSLFI
jgi:hypothetical protein